MISLGLGTVVAGNGSSFGGFTSEYQAILTAGSGFTRPSASQQILQNQLIIDLKAAGVWSKLDSFMMFRNDGSREFATINWKDTTNLATVPSGNSFPTFSSAYGFQGDGSTMSLNLNTSGQTNFTRDSSSFGIYINDLGASIANSKSFVGATGNDGTKNTFIRYAGGRINGIAVGTIPSASPLKHIMVNKLNTTSTLYANGISQATGSGTGVLDTNNFFLFRYADLPTSFGLGQVSCFYKGSDLSGQAASLDLIIRNYIASLNTFSSDTLAYQSNIVANGGTINLATLDVLDTYFFRPAATNGNILNQLDRLNIYAGLGSFQIAARTNLIKSSHYVTPVNSPTFDANGYKSNGSTSYLNLNYNPSTQGVKFTQDSNIAGVVFKNINTSASFTAIGSINTGGNTAHTVEFRSGDSSLRSYNNSTTGTFPPPMSLTPLASGILFTSTRRTSSTAAEVIANATSAPFTLSSNGLVNVNQFELAFNNSGVAASSYDANNYHVCSYHGSSSLDYTNFRTFILNVLTALNV
jgi:hypothetical protein